MDHTGLAPALGGMYFPGLHCSGSGCWVLHKGTDLVVQFVPFPGQSSSADQVLGEHTVPGGLYVLITSPVPAAWLPRCTSRAPSLVFHVSPLGS